MSLETDGFGRLGASSGTMGSPCLKESHHHARLRVNAGNRFLAKP